MKNHGDRNIDTTLLIPDYVIKDKNLSNYALSVYCVLQYLAIPTRSFKQCVTYDQLEFYLTGMISDRRRFTGYMRDGICELIDGGIITKISEIHKHYILDCSNLWIDINVDRFTKVTFNEVNKIFQIENVNNFLLLRYFILLMSTITSSITVTLSNGNSKNRVVGNFTIENIANITGVSERTVIDYNNLLEENNLLYVYRDYDFVLDDRNNIKRPSNVYGRLCDREYIKEFASQKGKYVSAYNYIRADENTTNNNRRLAQKYQQILKGGGEKYSRTEIIEIYDYVIAQNTKYKKLYEKNNYSDYLNKIRDTSIFDKFDFIETDRQIREY